MIKMICLILGGGVGSRLYPLTESRSKPAVSIGGKYRLIDIPISNCLNSGVKRMFVLTQFNSASLNQHIKNTYHFDTFSHGFVDILAAEQTHESDKWFQGTADAVRQSMHHISNHDHDYVLILSGDQLYQMDFELMAKHHIQSGADLTLATIPVNAQDAPGFGIMKVNKEGNIETFIEKPKPAQLPHWTSEVSEEMKMQGRNYLASMGIYIFGKEILKQLFDGNKEAVDFGKEIIPAAIQSGLRVASYQYEGYWTDIGSIRSFYEANLELTHDIPQFNFFDNLRPIYTRPRMLPPSKIFGTAIHHSVVAEGCILHAESIQGSLIGIRTRIGRNTVIKNSILMGADFFETIEDIVHNTGQIPMGIGNNCVLHQVIVDKNARVGNNVKIIGDDSLAEVREEAYSIVDGIIVLKKGAIIPDNTCIGKI
jgi:glucose-1-phosphate adenylyltransferase